MQNNKPKNKTPRQTNFNNEITGAYHKDNFFDAPDWKVIIGVAVMIGASAVIYLLAF